MVRVQVSIVPHLAVLDRFISFDLWKGLGEELIVLLFGATQNELEQFGGIL